MTTRRSLSRARRGISPAHAHSHAHDPLAASPAEPAEDDIVKTTTVYSASAQLRFLADSAAANAELFWQLRSADGDSCDSAVSAPPGCALVYVHEVRATDTLPAVVLTYNTDAATVKKTNRLWANDAIHSRATIMLPVDKCALPLQCHLRAEKGAMSSLRGIPAGSSLVGWGIVDGVGRHVEICAVPHSRLGYFPAGTAANTGQDASRLSVDSAVSVVSAVSEASSSTTVNDDSSHSDDSETLPSTPISSEPTYSPNWLTKVVRGFSVGSSAESDVVAATPRRQNAKPVPSRLGRSRSPRVVEPERYEMLPEEELYR
ncbi:uncharacterized protein V2V93DRAFT_370304 [Kockiozyma suomiensis]|uniref:uncharacterized protein n=1 Tax=Kockiozyma suomiensis TaxID=1337062 RepID=UPI00334374DA